MAGGFLCAGVCTILLSSAAGACTAEIAGGTVAEVDETEEPGEPDPSEPEPEPEPEPDPEPEPEPEPGFDVNDPADYLWTLTVERFYTLEVLRGSAKVQWSRFAPGVDPQTGQAADGGAFAGPTVLAQDLRFSDLTGSAFQFRTIREQDGHPMTSCVKLVEGGAAIDAHNQILQVGYPDTDPLGFTNPALYAAHLSQLGGVLLLVYGDCTTIAQENPSEQRSVLSFAAVTMTAVPDPQIYDPASDPDPSAGIYPAGA